MPIVKDDYSPPFWARNGHLSSVHPYFLRRPASPQFERLRLTTSDDDFIDIDQLKKGNNRLVILLHGLEGSSSSQYILSASTLFHDAAWDVIALNHRSCSGEINLKPQMYHSGFTQDLHLLCERESVNYDEIVLMGFSLGGNMVSKYLSDGVYSIDEKIKCGIAVSVPTHLASGAVELGKFINKIYTIGFLDSLIPKAIEKAKQYPDLIDVSGIKKIKTLLDFDHKFTAPLHGFIDAWDYYEQSSSLQFLPNLQKPLLMINAINDPFLGDSCYPVNIAKSTDLFHLNITKYGGHVGFVSKEFYNYPELQALEFASNQSFTTVSL